MARIRSVKPEFWSDRRLATRVSRDARLLYMALWNFADEHARLQGDSRYVKGNCLPYDDDLGLADIDRLLAELERAGRIQRYDHDCDPYIFLPKLAEHQRLEAEKVPSRLPEPPEPSPRGDEGSEQSASRADESARDADTNALLYVAGGREQVAGGRDIAPAKPPRAAREPDRVWDALLEACGVDSASVTASSRGAYNRATTDLRAVGADPPEIHRRAEHFRQRWPDASLTPTALARRWAECDRPPTSASPTPSRNERIITEARRRAEAAEAQHRRALP